MVLPLLSYEFPFPRKFHVIGYPDNYDNARVMYGVTGELGRIGNGLVEMLGNPYGHGAGGGL
ncbi:TPA: hypothetical protein QC183_003383 [Bacillus cereus]|nr:hypothetical protein [Bacillus cereus]